MSFNYTCPFCNTKTTITDSDYTKSEDQFTRGERILKIHWILCPNSDCNKTSLVTVLHHFKYSSDYQKWRLGEEIKTWRLLPESIAKVFPDYIPQQLIQDYEEAAKILNLSPKASATLSRRCLQGIIRNFWGISKGKLIDEINAIQDKVDPLVWKSIDAVRQVGNIGAHMEKDINLIIDVEPQEAILLIELIELLFEEWYVHKYEREQKLISISALAKKKSEQKAEQKKTEG
jgi:hypothetical protein